MLGLWSRSTVKPLPSTAPDASEIAFTVTDADTVRATHLDWMGRCLIMAQGPTQMDFGHTFVALDPDGRRIHVLTPERP
jgi:predicted enzyme related to lactoylglutathione lyase